MSNNIEENETLDNRLFLLYDVFRGDERTVTYKEMCNGFGKKTADNIIYGDNDYWYVTEI